MTHEEVGALLPGYAAATLDLADAARVRTHLASGCRDCLRELFGGPGELRHPASPEHAPAPPPHPVPTPHAPAPPARNRRALAVAFVCALAAAGFGAWTAREIQRRERRAPPHPAHPVSHSRGERLAPGLPEPDGRGPRRAGGERPEAPGRPADAGGKAGSEPAAERGEAAPSERATPTDGERSAALITYSSDVLSVSVAKAPLTTVLEEIGRQSGAAIRGEASAREVGASFEDVPLPEALHRLLGDQNFALRYSPEGKLRTIELLGEPSALAAAQTAPADARTPDEPTSGRRYWHHGVQFSRETLPDGQVRVTVAGTGGASGSPDVPARRGGLSEQGGTTQGQSSQDNWPPPDEVDRKLRRRFLDLLAHMDGSALAQYFATPDGQRTQAFLEDFAAHHSFDGSRQKATGILDRIPGRANQAP